MSDTMPDKGASWGWSVVCLEQKVGREQQQRGGWRMFVFV